MTTRGEVSGRRTVPARTHSWLPLWSAMLVTLGGIWSIVSIMFRRHEWRGWVEESFNLIGVPATPSLFVGCLLLLLAEGLRRRLRIAWSVVLLFQVVGLASYLLTVLYVVLAAEDVIERDDEIMTGIPYALVMAVAVIGTITSIAILVLFIRFRAAFVARTRHGSFRRAFLVLLLGLTAVTTFILMMSFAFPNRLHGPGERLWWAVRVTTGLSLPFGLDVAGHRGPPWLATLAGVLAAIVLLIAIGVFISSARRAELMTAQDELRLRALIAANGETDSLSYFATRRDKSVVFSPDGSAAITYRVVGTVCLAAGDPEGPVAAWPQAIRNWTTLAHEHAWHPAVLSASETGAQAYLAEGLHARPLGDEAIIDVDHFTLEGKTMRPVKRAVAKAHEAGYEFSVHRHADLPPAVLQEITQRAHDWLGGETDRGFSMALNRLGDRSDGRCIVVQARDGEGTLKALQSFVPWGTRGLSLDVMRRSPEAVNGVNEAIVSALVEAAPDFGVRRISLNFAMFRSIFVDSEKIGAGTLVRMAARVLSIADRYWQLESLYEANAKYQPRWATRYLCFESAAAVPFIALAAGVAEGFLPGRSPSVYRTGEDPLTLPGAEPRPLADLIIDQDTELLAPVVPVRRLTEQQQVRHDKLETMRAAGMDPYPVSAPRTCSVQEALAALEATPQDGATQDGATQDGATQDGATQDGATQDGAAGGDPVSVIGRVRALRDLGGVLFAAVEEHGVRVQALFDAATVDPGSMTLWRRSVDLGDHVSVTGRLGRSRSGEPSILVDSWTMASKCLRPLPLRGFTDPEARVRQRYVDLIVNPDSLNMMRARSRAVAAIRSSFTTRDFIEVETPMLQAVHGGANARPFRTHINAYNADLYLRIAPELYLKELCVGGMDRIFELNRNFRNEGADATHNPEFTSVEAYAAHGDYNTMRDLTRELILEVATAMHGEPVALQPNADGVIERLRLDGPWPVISVHEAASRATGVELTTATPLAELVELAGRHDIEVPPSMTAGEVVLELYDALVEKQTRFPTFYTDFPLETSPLTRIHRSDPALSERWDLVAFGAEIGTAYSELVDPEDQRRRLTTQSLKAAAGDPEAMEVDEGFLTALEYAMPPMGGLGIGVDRLVMMLTGANIRATLAFPFVRPADSAGG